MTVEAQIFSTLSSLVSSRVFPDVAPIRTRKPYIVYQRVGGQVINYQANEAPEKRNGRFQVSIWGKTRLEVSGLALSVEDALRASNSFQAEPISEAMSIHEPELELYGSQQDFSIWSSR